MIRNIVFDLCGPIITIDIGMIDAALHKLGIREEEPYLVLYQQGITKKFESAVIEAEEFCKIVRNTFHISATNNQIEETWNALIRDFDTRHATCIQLLKDQGYHTFLLSNSDIFNARYFHDYLNEKCGYEFVEQAFDEAVFSYTLGVRKPDPQIFQYLLDKHRLLPEETLFIDDCQKHCQGAASVGISAHWLEKGEDLCEVVERLLK